MVEGAFELADGALVVAVDPGLGGRIASVEVDGLEVLVVDGASPLEQGWYPMAPYAGRVRGGRFRVDDVEHQLPLTAWPNAIHGTVHSLPWDVDERSEASCTLSVGLGAGWPFAGRARHRIELADGGVRVQLEVTSEGEAFPASCGWHPWLRRDLGVGGPASITLHAGAMWERGDDHLPTGRLVPPGPGPWDDCFTELTWPAVVRWPGALAVEVVSSCQHVVVFDERPEGVCVEPQTGPPDALTIAPVLVTPERPLVAEAAYRFRADDGG